MEFSKAIFQVFNLNTVIYSVLILLFIIIDIFSSSSTTSITIFTKTPPAKPSKTILSSPHSLANLKSPNTSSIQNLKNTSTVRKRPICNIFQGRWMVDDGQSRPSYQPGECPYVHPNFNCLKSGRLDLNYTMLRWKPDDCDLPRFTRRKMAKFLRGKRLAFVGDSLSRNMYQSLLCMLTNTVTNEKKVLVVRKMKRFGAFRFESANFPNDNFTIDYIQMQFLVQKSGGKLQLDVMANVSENYKDADIIVFNSGHWWRHKITNHGNNFYQEGKHVHKHLAPKTAFKKALKTWSKWVDSNINTTRTQVFFRSYSPVHYSGGQWNSGGTCRGEKFPITKLRNFEKLELQDTLETALRKMSTPVQYLNITTMSYYRKDAHPSIFRGGKINETIQDCSHWCLPGVPDSWNELLFTMLMANKNRFQIKTSRL